MSAAGYDHVVVGGGAAGCILAARLSADPAVRVLLLESGRHRRSPLLSVPAAETVLMGNPRYDWCFATEPDPTLGGRRLDIPRGRLLGGSNAINGMIFVRGQRQDYDDWAALGNPGWGWDDVLPFFRRLESAPGFPGPARGQDGPVHVGLPAERLDLCETFLTAAGKSGYPANPDYNSGDLEGFGWYQINQRDGRRSSAAGGYLDPARGRPNLTVLTQAHVTALTFRGTRCTGVRYRRRGRDAEVACSGDVVLSAGTIQSPQLLELSGIGAADRLRALGLSVVADLPGVGENFRDHFAARVKWRVRQPVTFNERSRGTALAREVGRYLRHRDGFLSLPIAQAFGFVRSDDAQPYPDLQFHFSPASYGAGSTRRLDTSPGMTLGVYPVRPQATGSVHVRSTAPDRAPEIRTRFLEPAADRARLLAGIRIARQIVGDAVMDGYRGEELFPGPGPAGDEDLLALVRERGDTSYHPVGTCRMGPDPMAVVDHRLRVHGVEGVRVVDASVMPDLVSGNTNAASLMIGEKGAAMILEDDRSAA